MLSKSKSNWREGILNLVRKRIAEFQSSHPNIICSVRSPRPRSAKEAVSLIGAVYLVTEDRYWESAEIIDKIRKLARRYQYLGGWRFVQDILEHSKTFPQYKDYVLTQMSTNDYYGNLIRKIYNWIRLLTPSAEGQQSGPVRKRARKRGYDDKGTLRPNHTKGRNLPSPTDDREDRTGLVLHPLLCENLNPEDKCGWQTHPDREEVNENVIFYV